MSQAVVSPRTYAVIFVALLGLTGATYALSDVHLSPLGHVVVALGIAGTKTLLVALFFMHLLASPRLIWLMLLCGVMFLTIMLVSILSDYWTRDWIPQVTFPTTSRPITW